MSRKGENIYKRKDGRWEGRYKKGRKKNGKIHYGYVYGESYNTVRSNLLIKKAEHIKYKDSVEIYGGTLEEWIEGWIKKKSTILKDSTISSYIHKSKKYIFPYAGDILLKDVTTSDLFDIVAQLQEKKISQTTIQVVVGILKKTFSDAKLSNIISHNPCDQFRVNTSEKNKVYALTKDEQKRLEKACLSHLYGLPVLLALRTGLRIGEICALKWENVDFTSKLIHVKETYQRIPVRNSKQKTVLKISSAKSKSSNRMIPLSSQVIEWLTLHFETSNEENAFVFSVNQKPIEPRLLTYYFHNIRSKSNLEHINFHQLRHTFATRCLEANGDIASISALLGHSSAKLTLDIYADSIFAQRIITINNMEENLAL